jgi:hypothetical protein
LLLRLVALPYLSVLGVDGFGIFDPSVIAVVPLLATSLIKVRAVSAGVAVSPMIARVTESDDGVFVI